jgi:hypothetical protein
VTSELEEGMVLLDVAFALLDVSLEAIKLEEAEFEDKELEEITIEGREIEEDDCVVVAEEKCGPGMVTTNRLVEEVSSGLTRVEQVSVVVARLTKFKYSVDVTGCARYVINSSFQQNFRGKEEQVESERSQRR